jgi:acyl-CoA reductase-like NAD-dependent aldehyde dehydrogenase
MTGMSSRAIWQAIIDGQPRDAIGGGSFTVDEPATGRPLAQVVQCGAKDVDLAVAAADRALRAGWRAMPPIPRAMLLRRVAEEVRRHAEELAALEAQEVGKPIHQSRMFDVMFCSTAFDFFAGLADKVHGEAIPQGPIDTYTIREPYGVVAAIIPFNWPPIHFAGKVAPALATGNTVVIKPGEQAPLTLIRLTEILNTVLPPGVVNIVPGDGPEAGAALVRHPRVGMVSFTGATATGRHVLRGAAENLTPALMELGGKNPFIVMPDADLSIAVPAAVEGMFFNQGEACTAASRILLHEDIRDAFLADFLPRVAAIRLGDPLDEATDMGPLVTRAQQQRVLGFLETAREEGATILVEGALPDDERLRDGFYVRPTVLTDVDQRSRLVQEEVFGPVVTIQTFGSYEQAIGMANDSDFGLVAGVFTADMTLARRAGRDIEAGVVFVNNYNRTFLGMPFGGMKGSGFGREHALETLNEFVRTKAVRVPSGEGQVPVWRGALREEERGA